MTDKEKILTYIKEHGNVSYKEICLNVLMNCDADLKILLADNKITAIEMCSDSPENRASFSKYIGFGIMGYKVICEHNSTTNLFGGEKTQCLDCGETIKPITT